MKNTPNQSEATIEKQPAGVPKENRLGVEPVHSLLIRTSIPLMISMLVQSLYNIVDSIFVAQINEDALTAVSFCFPVQQLIISFAIGTAVGFSALMSRYLGAKDFKRVNKIAAHGLFLEWVTYIPFLLVGFFARPFMEVQSDNPRIIEYGTTYLSIVCFLSIMVFTQISLERFMQSTGKTLFIFFTQTLGAVINIIMDPILIFGFGMGVRGAALATILSQIISAVLVMGSLMRTRDIYRLHLRKISIDWIMLKRIIRIGFPAGVQSILYSVSNVIIQSAVNSLGTNNVAAWAAYGKVDGLFWMMINALGIAATTFVGQNYGAKKMDRVHRGVRTSMIMAFLMTGLMVVFMWFIGDTLISLFTTDTAVREICHGLIHFLVPTFFTYISIEILSGALRGVGDAWIPMFITGIGICGVRIVWMTAVLPHFHSLKGAAFCYPLSWVITTIAYFIYYLFFSQLSKRKELRSI